MRISDWSSDVCSSDLANADAIRANLSKIKLPQGFKIDLYAVVPDARHMAVGPQGIVTFVGTRKTDVWARSEEHTSELQSLMRISYAVFCLKKKNKFMNTQVPT